MLCLMLTLGEVLELAVEQELGAGMGGGTARHSLGGEGGSGGVDML